MSLPRISGPVTARAIYTLHRTWVSVWPVSRGRHTLCRLIGRAARLGAFPPVWAKLPHGWMLLDPRDFVQRSILAHGEWAPEAEALIRDRLHTGDCFVDIGANVGYFSLLAASIVGTAGRVLAFEPNPATRAILVGNIERSGYRNIEVRSECCSDSAGTVTLYLNAVNNTGTCSLSSSNASGASTVPVEALRADSVIRSLPKPPALIKIDVEGAEEMVLRGMPETLASGPTVIFEMNECLLRGMGSSVEGVKELLSGFALTVFGNDCIAEPPTPICD